MSTEGELDELVEVDVMVTSSALEEEDTEGLDRFAGPHPDAIEADARALLAHLGLSPAVLSIVLCDDETIQSYNLDYRGKDAPTDVLSFAQWEGEGTLEDDPVLGDLVISLDTARRQAAELGHDEASEVRVLLVHGLLHLLGYDHELGEEEAAEMEAREVALLAALGEERPSLLRRVRGSEDELGAGGNGETG